MVPLPPLLSCPRSVGSVLRPGQILQLDEQNAEIKLAVLVHNLPRMFFGLCEIVVAMHLVPEMAIRSCFFVRPTQKACLVNKKKKRRAREKGWAIFFFLKRARGKRRDEEIIVQKKRI